MSLRANVVTHVLIEKRSQGKGDLSIYKGEKVYSITFDVLQLFLENLLVSTFRQKGVFFLSLD